MKSMTGFGLEELITENFDVNILIKTVNNKYLDIKVSLPDEFIQYEKKIIKLIESYIKRGTVYLKIQFYKKEPDQYEINTKKLNEVKKIYSRLQNEMASYLNNIQMNLESLVEKYELIKVTQTDINEKTFEKILQTIEKALQKHREMALKEGANMKKFINKSIKKIEKALKTIVEDYPKYKEKLKERLTDAIKDISSQPYNRETMQRFMLELSFYIEKYDVSEELLRLQSHIKSFKSVMKKTEPIGKKMNFILQEMRREINTTSSKYNDIKIFDAIIVIKDEIEKIREIIQNVE